MGNKYFRNRTYFPIPQIETMRKNYPNQFTNKWNNNKLIFYGKIRPTPEMDEYVVKIIYNGTCKNPTVYVISPQLDKDTPHIYSDGCLCLYHPNNFKWDCRKFIANEIVQWTTAWLYFYECWLDTGVWYGPEVQHESNKNK